MKRLWAPWRLTYVQEGSCEDSCIFCLRDCPDEDGARHVLARGDDCFVILNRFPYSNGHLMVAPYRHLDQPAAMTPDEVAELHRLTVLSIEVLRHAYRPQGFNVGLNLGKTAGAGVESHLHQHIVPRWDGDTNFMPVLADARVIPQHLEDTYRQLKTIFDDLRGG